MIKRLIAALLSVLCWKLLALLRNGKRVPLSREEIRHVDLTFSSYGEDLVVLSYFRRWDQEDPGQDRLYVDVGAFDPAILSTTLLMHKLGWKGINIDLDAEKIACFQKSRPSDHNVVAAVSSRPGVVRHLKYALGTTNRIVDLSEQNLASLCHEQPLSMAEVRTVTLTEILDTSPFANRSIDYLNVDCEGHDLSVLHSLDFARYAPRVITVEAFTSDEREALCQFLGPWGYSLDAILRFTMVFVTGAGNETATSNEAGSSQAALRSSLGN